MNFKVAVMLIGTIFSVQAFAYKVATHGVVAQKAYEGLLQEDPGFLERLGFKASSGRLGKTYYDTANSKIYSRGERGYERIIIQRELDQDHLAIHGWLMRGAIREDDICPGLPQLPFAPCDATNNMVRVFNHFYDPVNDRALTLPFLGIMGEKAPDWALGVDQFLNDVDTPNASRDNHFTVFDAREA